MSVAPKSLVSARTVASKQATVPSIQTQRIPAFPGRAAQSPIAPVPLRRNRKRQLKATSVEKGRLHPTKTPLNPLETHPPNPKILPTSQSMPGWLTQLIAWQRRSSLVTLLLAGATLAVYGGTVYTQQLWIREYRQLETLQRQERQLTAAGEVLKNQLADQAQQPGTGLVPSTPNTNVFLEPATRSERTTTGATPSQEPSANPELTPTPLGY